MATAPDEDPYNIPMLVLASASPRRQELLRNAGISFEVHPADIPEDPLPGESAKDCAERLAREKALAVARVRPNLSPNDVVLGADTVVVVDGALANAFGAHASRDYGSVLGGGRRGAGVQRDYGCDRESTHRPRHRRLRC
jgi:hypothetical protein